MTEMVRRWGHCIGLHGCAHSLRRRDYGRQREALAHAAGGDVTGHRNHYLVFDAAQSPGLLATGGLRVDSSCGFHDANGFRAGVAHPYRLWDRQVGGPSTVTEIPLIFMDNAFRAPLEAQWAQAYERIEQAAVVGGAIAILLHVDRFLENEGCLQRYAGLLDWLKARGVDLAGGMPCC
jgi:peptidoglycan/xylan/chitin deacetylase (PgdA/CDA1 family)